MGSGSSSAPKSTPLEDRLAADTQDTPRLRSREPSSPSHAPRSSTRPSIPADKRAVCKFFAKDSHCKFGDKCRYSHDTHGGSDIAPKGKGDGKGKKSKTPCREFLKGTCKYGDSCRYSHVNPNQEDEVSMELKVNGTAPEDVLRLSSADVAMSNSMSFDEAQDILQEVKSEVETKAKTLSLAKHTLVPAVEGMDDEERTLNGGIQWQFRGKRSEGNFYDFESEKSQEIEEAYQAWVDGGRSKKHSDRRYETEVKGGHKITLDFHLSTQRAAKGGAVRVLRRYELPSKAHEMSKGYFDSVLALVGDTCDKIETVNGRKAGMGLTSAERSELANLEDGSVESMRVIVEGFIQLALLCNAGELLEKLIAVLGPARAGRLGVEASGRKMRLQGVCKALRLAFEQKSYGKPLLESESGWARVQVLCTMGRFFYGQPLLKIRQNMVKYRNDGMQMSRRHAFMLAGMLLNESSDDPAFTAECKKQIRPLLQEGLQIAMTGGGDMEAIGAILSNCRALESGFIDITPVSAWLTSRLRMSIASLQPVEWTAELLSQIKNFVGIDASKVVCPVIDDLTEKCAKAISDATMLPENVNQLAIFSKLSGEFDDRIFETLTPYYEDTETRAIVIEWLIAYCEHMKLDLPDYCMTSDQAECFESLTNALDSFADAGGDTAVIKNAVIAAKLVPNLKDNADLCEVFEKALAVLKKEARLPPGWDLEDLLGTEKLFKKEEVTSPEALALFQNLMDSTHQKRWTRDRAVRGDGDKIADRFVVTRVTEIMNQASWENYDRRRQEIIKGCKARVSDAQWEKWSGRVMTKDLGEQIAKVCQLTPLEQNCNEFLMFHGAKPMVADLIAENHFDISFASKDGMFGAGLYFAEASSKSDEYCSPNDQSEFPLILVRCTLGKLNYVDTPKPYDNPGRRQLEHSCMSGTFNSVLGDRIKVSNTYREFVIYDHFQAYPHFILWYRRQ